MIKKREKHNGVRGGQSFRLDDKNNDNTKKTT
jgi:hypothetical protein